MEKYFIATEGSKLRKDYLDYRQNLKDVNVFAKQFIQDNNMETFEYSCDSQSFYIVPTEKDEEKFNKMLSGDIGNGLCRFKGNSKIGRAWKKFVLSNDIHFKNKPMLIFYLKGTYGRSRSNIFEINDVVYCYFESESNFELTNGLQEIKASEYYKVIEDNEERFA